MSVFREGRGTVNLHHSTYPKFLSFYCKLKIFFLFFLSLDYFIFEKINYFLHFGYIYVYMCVGDEEVM